MGQLPLLLVCIFLLLIVWNRQWAFIYFMICHMLLPPIVRVGAISMNTLMAVLLLTTAILELLVQKKNRSGSIKKEIAIPILCLIVPLGLIGTFAELNYEFQLTSLFQFFLTEISPYISLIVFIRSSKDLNRFIYALLISYCIIGSYGIITYLIRMNPLYVFFVSNYTDGYDVADYTGDGFASLRGGLTAAASGNLSGPLPWGQESMLIALFLLFNKQIKNRPLLVIALVLAIINSFLSGKRSCFTPLILAFVYFAISRKLFTAKNITAVLVVVTSIILVINVFPQLQKFKSNFVTAVFFWDDKLAEKEDVNGSSLDMRINQFEYTNSMISKNPLVGLGYNWPSYYAERNGLHPYMFGFESIYFRTIVESGVLGLIIWTVFFVKFFKATDEKSNHKENLVFHIGFILSCLLTGIQASMWIYMLLAGILLKQNEQLKVANDRK